MDQSGGSPQTISGPDDPPALAGRIRALLAAWDPATPFLTYQAAAMALGLTPPGVIQTLARALEYTMSEDVQAGRPMIAALVISRTGKTPRQGFFDLAVSLGRFPPDPGCHFAAWQAECRAALGSTAGQAR